MWGSEPVVWGSEPLMWGSEVSFAKNRVRRSEMWGSPSLPRPDRHEDMIQGLTSEEKSIAD